MMSHDAIAAAPPVVSTPASGLPMQSFNEERVLTDLQGFRYRRAYDYVWYRLMSNDPLCVDFIRCHHDHVLLLYLEVRNVMRFVKKASFTLGTAELKIVLRNVIYLIVRVTQDVTACETVLAKSGVQAKLKTFFDKLIGWLSGLSTITANGTEHWPSLTSIVDTLKPMCTKDKVTTLPLPLWVPEFAQARIGSHMYFENPDSATITSGISNEVAINDVRTNAATQMLQAIRHTMSWKALMNCMLSSLIVIPMKKAAVVTTTAPTTTERAPVPHALPLHPRRPALQPVQMLWGRSSRKLNSQPKGSQDKHVLNTSGGV